LVAQDCQRLHINNCTILDCQNAGLLLENVSHSRIADCFIRDDRDPQHPSTPLRQIGGRDNQLLNNTFLGQPELGD
jgi:hypothetical protein